jgi:hypothetical protein
MKQIIAVEKQLKIDLELILQSNEAMNEKAKKGVSLIKEKLSAIRKRVRETGFETEEDEIYFFRKVKPPIHGNLIFFSILSEIETSKMHMSDEELNVLISKKFSKFRKIMREHSEFVAYYNQDMTHLDKTYFLRASEIVKVTSHITSVLLDPEFNTVYDVVIANLFAMQLLQNHINIPLQIKKELRIEIPSLKWTASKSDFIEFIYGLQATFAVNNGEVEIKELCQAMQSIFQVQIDDPYRIFIDLSNRKISPMKFIPKMEEGLLRRIKETKG